MLKYISFFVLNILSGNKSPNLNEYLITVVIPEAAEGPKLPSPRTGAKSGSDYRYGQNITEGSNIVCAVN